MPCFAAQGGDGLGRDASMRGGEPLVGLRATVFRLGHFVVGDHAALEEVAPRGDRRHGTADAARPDDEDPHDGLFSGCIRAMVGGRGLLETLRRAGRSGSGRVPLRAAMRNEGGSPPDREREGSRWRC